MLSINAWLNFNKIKSSIDFSELMTLNPFKFNEMILKASQGGIAGQNAITTEISGSALLSMAPIHLLEIILEKFSEIGELNAEFQNKINELLK